MNDTKLTDFASSKNAAKTVVFSGMRPTGRLHLGNYFGALKNWIELQEKYSCYFCVVDWHMLTTGYADTSKLQENIREMVLDWLAAGLDPKKCVIFKQSDVSEHAELALLLGMVTNLSWLENNPTWKDQLQELAMTKASKAEEVIGTAFVRKEESEILVAERMVSELAPRTFGFLGYPVLQAADIFLYNANIVPVGHDQLPHIELAREIIRQFNRIFGKVFDEPQALLTPTPKIPGTDGRKMSKSYENTIQMLETEDSLKRKIQSLYTDPTRIKATDPGHPEPCSDNPPGCAAFSLHKIYAPEDFVKQRKSDCIAGKIGCVACKKDLFAEMKEPFAQFKEKREQLSSDPKTVSEILESGKKKAKTAAALTMDRVRRAMNLV